MNKYLIQSEFIQRTTRAKNAENARKNFLRYVQEKHPTLYEFIEDNIDITCIEDEVGEGVGWIDEVASYEK